MSNTINMTDEARHQAGLHLLWALREEAEKFASEIGGFLDNGDELLADIRSTFQGMVQLSKALDATNLIGGWNADGDERRRAYAALELARYDGLGRAEERRRRDLYLASSARGAEDQAYEHTPEATADATATIAVPDELLPFLRAAAIYRVDRVTDVTEDGALRQIGHAIFDPRGWGAITAAEKRAAIDARNQLDEAFAVLDLVGDPSTDASPGALPARLVAELAQEALEQMGHPIRDAASSEVDAANVDWITSRARLMGQMLILQSRAANLDLAPAEMKESAEQREAVCA